MWDRAQIEASQPTAPLSAQRCCRFVTKRFLGTGPAGHAGRPRRRSRDSGRLAGVWTVSLLDNLNIAWGERRECYPMQSNRIVGITSDYRVQTNLFCISQYCCEARKECTIEF